jgi:sec-independent protein translocase protein TatC
MGWICYWSEFRRRAAYFLLAIAAVFLWGMTDIEGHYQQFVAPVIAALPPGSHIIALHLTAPLWVPIKMIAFLALLLAMPVGLYQFWAFIAPALYPKERRRFWPWLIASVVLFYTGVLLAYSVVLPWLLRCIVMQVPVGVRLLPDMEGFLSFATGLMLLTGWMLEIPLLIMLLLQTGWVKIAKLAMLRRYWICFAFILGMIITPPDVLSQCLFALPMIALFELGLLLARVADRFTARASRVPKYSKEGKPAR